MNTHEYISAICFDIKENEKLESYKKGLPIGKDERGEIALAQKREKMLTVRNTCVTGAKRTEFIRRMALTWPSLYDREQAFVFVVSPKQEYGELLRFHSIDATVPYVRNKEDLQKATDTLKELLQIRSANSRNARLFLILDGLEEIADLDGNGDLEEYRKIYELVMRKPDIDIITGVDLAKSIFAGYPGTFVGIGNCLVTTRESGKADVTYVGEDSTLSLPAPITYPNEPSVKESIVLLNTYPTQTADDEE